jgi:NAD(P)-dependent dehydrogenase (short-subunit alcohol dehydrogenase family)
MDSRQDCPLTIKRQSTGIILNSYDVILTGSSGRIGSELLTLLTEAGLRVKPVDLSLGDDLGDEQYVDELFKNNHANSLVNLFALNEHISKGATQAKTIWDFSLRDIDHYLHTNITNLFSVCRSFAKYNETASIVNFSSIYGVVTPKPDLYDGYLKHVGYPVSKSAVISLSEYLAICLAPKIRVNTIVPGGVLSEQSPEFIERYSKRCPMGRMALPEDLLGIVKLLIGKESSYITGATFNVDGGWVL